ncbi:MAG: PEP-CTERM sorting domain-containing protein [Planctomycetia bacterium]|nr:PEP-CTERM sorting domain-containing protein [Planctomycetia bacterium]
MASARTIGFNRSGGGAGNFIGSFAEVGTADGVGMTTFGAPIQLKAGQNNYHLFNVSAERWGDYSATRVDPSSPNIFWTFQGYAVGNNFWGTQITQIIVPEPGGVVLLAIGMFGLAARAW